MRLLAKGGSTKHAFDGIFTSDTTAPRAARAADSKLPVMSASASVAADARVTLEVQLSACTQRRATPSCRAASTMCSGVAAFPEATSGNSEAFIPSEVATPPVALRTASSVALSSYPPSSRCSQRSPLARQPPTRPLDRSTRHRCDDLERCLTRL